MKAEAFRDLSTDELHTRVQDLREQLLKLRFQRSTGQIENPQMAGSIRRDIARALTVLRERQLRPSGEATEVEGAGEAKEQGR